MLYVKNSSGNMEERPRLTSLPTSIDAVLTDSHGKNVCEDVRVLVDCSDSRCSAL
jgi:hypothetical protein